MIPILSKVLSSGAGNLIDSIGNVASKFINTKQDKDAFELQMSEEVNRHMETLSSQLESETKDYLADVNSARVMQEAALQQQDSFAKRFVYYLAAGVILLTVAYDFCFFWVNFPEVNRPILEQVSGVLNTSCLVMVISFFFGSSKSSEDKQKQLDTIINKS